jgi:hypothetical protein
MKQLYQQPLISTEQMDTDSLLSLSQNGTTLVIDPTQITEENAGGAASRHTDVWEEDNDEDI